MKTWYKISFLTIFFGWFFFMWLCLFGYTKSADVRAAIVLSGIFLCFIGSFAFLALLVNKAFWMKQEELEDYIKQHKESIKGYDEAKRKLEEHVLNSTQSETLHEH